MNILILATATSLLALGVVTSGILVLIAKAYVQVLLDKEVRRTLSERATLDHQPAALIAHRAAPICEAKMPSLAELYVS